MWLKTYLKLMCHTYFQVMYTKQTGDEREVLWGKSGENAVTIFLSPHGDELKKMLPPH